MPETHHVQQPWRAVTFSLFLNEAIKCHVTNEILQAVRCKGTSNFERMQRMVSRHQLHGVKAGAILIYSCNRCCDRKIALCKITSI